MSHISDAKAFASAAKSADEVDDIIYRISHDLRASIRALQELPVWITEDLQEAGLELPGAPARHLELIACHASRLDLMMLGLLEYSRVGRVQTIGVVKPHAVLEDVIDDLCLPADVTIHRDMDQGSVEIGEADMSRAFAILITNAINFHPTGNPRIKIAGGPRAKGIWRLEVEDNGPGIPVEHRETVFRPMTKLVSRDVDRGAGMGLAILRRIAEFYGGSVEILAPPGGVGTKVRLDLAIL